jgi:hypothetical protein
MKLVVNAVMGAMMASFAEGIGLAEQVCFHWVNCGFCLCFGVPFCVSFVCFLCHACVSRQGEAMCEFVDGCKWCALRAKPSKCCWLLLAVILGRWEGSERCLRVQAN